ncbi:hypothetical protein DQ04_05691050 [Trypanosoma grayi]|uniref:hypothetical protein n=1 Tax=Trypanosoma grayi TaxID=71804 RepID=UPI0004F40217|nr:hypothetical protein DQ04_05691050 [Trypanosoma grayi]KEG09169.1 hypothetical protein DQ04_05691050 [Trypanosoma grayi]
MPTRSAAPAPTLPLHTVATNAPSTATCEPTRMEQDESLNKNKQTRVTGSTKCHKRENKAKSIKGRRAAAAQVALTLLGQLIPEKHFHGSSCVRWTVFPRRPRGTGPPQLSAHSRAGSEGAGPAHQSVGCARNVPGGEAHMKHTGSRWKVRRGAACRRWGC